MTRYLQLQPQGAVTVVRIDRPPANALDIDLLRESHELLEGLDAERPGAVVITGRDGFFSAGIDLKLTPSLDADGRRELIEGINRLFAGWYQFPRPVICAVNGHAIAGGLILALCGDYRVGATQGKLGLTELRAGVPYPAVALAVVKAELTPSAARRLALGAQLVEPTEALELGLLDELAPPERVLPRALELADSLAEAPAETYERVKAQLRAEVIAEARAVISGERSEPLLDSWLGEESREASRALLARKRG